AAAKRMIPSPFHAPPRPAASARTLIKPVSTSIRISLPEAKKPTERLSGDQKGKEALSVPSNGFATPDSRERSQRSGGLEPATKMTFNASGEIAMNTGSALEGVATSTRNSPVLGCSAQIVAAT